MRRMMLIAALLLVVLFFASFAAVFIYWLPMDPLPSVADCSGRAIDVTAETARPRGILIERDFLSCSFWWYEARG